ncbi:MAG TPA: ATP-binding protein [Puia sp.]|uniref:ATP-binding protein n=1 Tax=Puia sp. TaxID=2045100 RepID=UPI002CF31C2F|nr:ATP-binding protein [Puia sp.]HVU94002.1 ATP-binding protein [Puia sp.]
MKNIRDISIRNKLILMQVFTSMLVLGIVFWTFVATEFRAYKTRRAESITSLAQVIAANSVSMLQFQDNDAAEKMLGELESVAPDIAVATILDKKGNAFARKMQGDTSRAQLEVSFPIRSNGESLGTIVLSARLSDLAAMKRSLLSMAMILTAIAIVASFLIARLVQASLSIRLERLAQVMTEVNQTGNYSRVMEESGEDEIGSLIRNFNNLLQKVKENERRKDEFIGVASHELKTPLTSIKGYLEMLTMVEMEQPKKQMVERAFANARKLEKLIQELLDVSKMQVGQLQLQLSAFDLGELIEEAVTAFRIVSRTHVIVVEELPKFRRVVADRQRIEQVLVNLLSNAVKYSPGEEKVVVSCEERPVEVVIEVRDLGPGIPVGEEEVIFDRFYRSKEVADHISGFGLGLYICRDIIRRHNGNIWVESRERGSAFRFSLPILNSTT